MTFAKVTIKGYSIAIQIRSHNDYMTTLCMHDQKTSLHKTRQMTKLAVRSVVGIMGAKVKVAN